MNAPITMFILWLLGMAMGAIPAWMLAKASLPKNWFFHLNFGRGGAPIVSGYPIKPNQRQVMIRDGQQKLVYPLISGYGSPYGVRNKTPKGTVYFGHAQRGVPFKLMARKEGAPNEAGQLLEWTWKSEVVHPNAAEMAAAQDDDRELKLVQASKQAARGGIPMMYLLIGIGALAFFLFMR